MHLALRSIWDVSRTPIGWIIVVLEGTTISSRVRVNYV